MAPQEEGGVIRDQPSPESQSGSKGRVGDGAYITHLRRRQVDTYAVTETELSSIDTKYWQANTHFSLASLALGGMLSAVLTWQTHRNWPVLVVLFATACAFVALGVWIHRTRRTLLKGIKEQTLPRDE